MSMHADDEHLKEGSPCPLCGEPLVIRHSAHGVEWKSEFTEV